MHKTPPPPTPGPQDRHLPAFLMVLAVFSCAAGPGTGRVTDPATLSRQQGVAGPAVVALQAGRFDEALRAADQALSVDRNNPGAHAVRGLCRYKAAMHQIRIDAETLVASGVIGGINQQYLTFSLGNAEAALAAVEADLAAAAAEPAFALELCPACWEVDWNGNGRIDSSDRHLFEIEEDAAGNRIDDSDPRRRPTFRLDLGDLYWARALISFQRATLDLLAAYRLSDLNAMLGSIMSGPKPKAVTLSLTDPGKVARARKRILEGLAHADRTRREYLAETDDDREWVPNPRQKSHPLPLPVDQALYQTWEGVVADLGRLVKGQEGLSLQAMAQLGKHKWQNPPRGYLNLGALLSQPRDITLDLAEIESVGDQTANAEQTLRHVLGSGYAEHMRPSPILGRMERMRKEMDRGEESMQRKLRYLFWLN